MQQVPSCHRFPRIRHPSHLPRFRAISFWQYQIHQEGTFQQAVVRNLNDKTAQLQKQLESVVREANAEINLLANKKAELERDLEIEKRKVRETQETAKERDKEYQKLKIQFDKLKRRALFGAAGNEGNPVVAPLANATPNQYLDDHRPKGRVALGNPLPNPVDLTAVVGGMEANRIQRTPLVARTLGAQANGGGYTNQQQHQPQASSVHRQPWGHFPSASNGGLTDHSHRTSHPGNFSDRSGSANEVEQMLTSAYQQPPRNVSTNAGWQVPPTTNTRAQAGQQRGFFAAAAQPQNKAPQGRFRPTR